MSKHHTHTKKSVADGKLKRGVKFRSALLELFLGILLFVIVSALTYFCDWFSLAYFFL